MGFFTCIKGQPTQLSAHFNSTEFDCHGKSCCNYTKVNEKLIIYLEDIREHFGVPVSVTSGYRCPSHNSSIGGAQRSQHRAGNAVDIIVKGIAPCEVAKYAESIGVLGIGLYETSKDGFFVHIDMREYKAFWYGQAQKAMTTFGGSHETGAAIVTNSGATYNILNRGDTGAEVEQLQKNLILLGYSCGGFGADGKYGRSTEEAVRAFQRNTSNLAPDGIAGPLTQAAINSAIAGSFAVGDTVVVVANLLNVRKGAGTNYAVMATVKKNAVYTLSEVKNGWGKLQELSGWVSLQYCQKQ